MDITPPVVATTTGRLRQMSERGGVFPKNPPVLKRRGGLETKFSGQVFRWTFVKEHSAAIFLDHDSEALPFWQQIVFDVPIGPISVSGILLHHNKNYNQEEGMQLLDDPRQGWRLYRPEESFGHHPLIIKKLLKSPCNNTDEHEPYCSCTLLPTSHKTTTSTSTGRFIQESQNIRGTSLARGWKRPPEDVRRPRANLKKWLMEKIKNTGRGLNKRLSAVPTSLCVLKQSSNYQNACIPSFLIMP